MYTASPVVELPFSPAKKAPTPGTFFNASVRFVVP